MNSRKQTFKKNKEIRKSKKSSYLMSLSSKKKNIENGTDPNSNLDQSTVSIAIPGSIMENAQSPELRSYLAGQIARAVCIFRVDEVIVFDDICCNADKEDSGSQKNIKSCLQLARILQYLECPQYLRKFFFPLHKDLKYSGLLNPLDAPHHLRKQNTFLYREGVVTERKTKENRTGSYVNVGLTNEVYVDKSLPNGIRVTVKMEPHIKRMRGKIVSPKEPRAKTGIYWGYSVRVAHSLSDVLTKSTFVGEYDLTIGTSDKGSNIYKTENLSLTYNHALIVFGGLKGIEFALKNDDKLRDVEDSKLLFDYYVNVVPLQGSRTVRTEEALLISLAILKEKLNPKVPDIEFVDKDQIASSEDTGVQQVVNLHNCKVSATDLSRFD